MKLVLAAVLAALGVVVAGCGGSSGPAVASLGTTTTASNPRTSVSSSSAAAGGSGAETSGGGGSGKIGVPFTVAGGTLQQMSKFAACMRANGEPSFPDPNAQGVISAGSLDRGSPQFEQALQACRKDLPNSTTSPAQQAQDLRQEDAFAACMHRNGVPSYPDPLPGTDGQVLRILPNSGLDPQSPLFQKAQQTCQKKVPGGGKG